MNARTKEKSTRLVGKMNAKNKEQGGLGVKDVKDFIKVLNKWKF